MKLEPRIEAVLAEYEAQQDQEDRLVATLSADEVGDRRDELLVTVGRNTGQLLNRLVRESAARSILELGTSAGYSTIWLAAAARAIGGRVTSIDLHAGKQQRALVSLERAGLSDRVRFWCGDAVDFLALPGECYDFILIDVWKDLYVACIDALLDRLAPGATIVADNMLEPPWARFAAARYQAHVRAIAGMETVLLHVGSGLAISRYRPGQAVAGA